MNVKMTERPFPIVYAQRDTSVFSATVVIPGGAMAEGDGQFGYAHLLEHMLFRGTKRFPTSKDLALHVEGVGGRFNAYTSYDATYLTATVPAIYWQNALDVLFSLAYEPSLEESALSTEKQVVISEVHMTQDQPDERAYIVLHEQMWDGHRLGVDILGHIEHIEAADSKTIKGFWERTFSHIPYVGLAGPIEFEEVQRYMASIEPPFELVKAPAPSEPTFRGGTKVVREDTEQTYYRLAFPSCKAGDIDAIHYGLLANILGGSSFSRMFLRIREQEGLSYSVYSALELTICAGALVLAADLKPGGVSRAKNIILEEIERLRQAKLEPSELEQFKRYTLGAYVMSLESTSRISKLLADRLFTRGEIWDPNTEISVIQSVTEHDIAERLTLSTSAGVAEVIFGP
ncbi:insulinase family protein [Coprothermobacteraceae bacterium]|nr:insulinase family protein [Coprothermobacteraceae bacterium]